MIEIQFIYKSLTPDCSTVSNSISLTITNGTAAPGYLTVPADCNLDNFKVYPNAAHSIEIELTYTMTVDQRIGGFLLYYTGKLRCMLESNYS